MAKKKTRKQIPKKTETQILVESRRKCCLCYFLEDNRSAMAGQIAHINGDRTDNRPENLAFLCLEHHDQFDSKTSQSKKITPNEVREYKEKLVREIANENGNDVAVEVNIGIDFDNFDEHESEVIAAIKKAGKIKGDLRITHKGRGSTKLRIQLSERELANLFSKLGSEEFRRLKIDSIQILDRPVFSEGFEESFGAQFANPDQLIDCFKRPTSEWHIDERGKDSDFENASVSIFIKVVEAKSRYAIVAKVVRADNSPGPPFFTSGLRIYQSMINISLRSDPVSVLRSFSDKFCFDLPEWFGMGRKISTNQLLDPSKVPFSEPQDFMDSMALYYDVGKQDAMVIAHVAFSPIAIRPLLVLAVDADRYIEGLRNAGMRIPAKVKKKLSKRLDS